LKKNNIAASAGLNYHTPCCVATSIPPNIVVLWVFCLTRIPDFPAWAGVSGEHTRLVPSDSAKIALVAQFG